MFQEFVFVLHRNTWSIVFLIKFNFQSNKLISELWNICCLCCRVFNCPWNDILLQRERKKHFLNSARSRIVHLLQGAIFFPCRKRGEKE